MPTVRIRPWSLLAAVLAFMLVTVQAQAMFSRMSESELISASAVIVVGTLVRHETVTAGGKERRVGIVEVDVVLKGGSIPAIVRLDLPQPGQPAASDTVAHRIGAKGLWYLRQHSAGDPPIYAADHPQRFVPLAEATPQIDQLRRSGRR